MTLRELHLFAGIGGGILGGMLLGHRCVGAVEINPYCRKVLRARQADGTLPAFPIHDDIRTFTGGSWRGRVDVVAGGFPCQPWSSCGHRRGTADERHLWPEMARIVAEVRPRYVFLENVNIEAFREPWRDLRELGYHVPPAIRLGTGDLNGASRRWRWWAVGADTGVVGREAGAPEHGAQIDMAIPHGSDPDRLAVAARRLWDRSRAVREVAGASVDLDRLRAIGNAQSPQVAAQAFRLLLDNLVSNSYC